MGGEVRLERIGELNAVHGVQAPEQVEYYGYRRSLSPYERTCMTTLYCSVRVGYCK